MTLINFVLTNLDLNRLKNSEIEHESLPELTTHRI